MFSCLGCQAICCICATFFVQCIYIYSCNLKFPIQIKDFEARKWKWIQASQQLSVGEIYGMTTIYKQKNIPVYTFSLSAYWCSTAINDFSTGWIKPSAINRRTEKPSRGCRVTKRRTPKPCRRGCDERPRHGAGVGDLPGPSSSRQKEI
jgi:hypothetical protein